MRSCMLLSDDGACSFATLRTLVNLLSLLGGARVLSVSAYVGIGTVTTAPARGRARADTAASSMLHALNVIETLPARGGEGGEGGRGGKRGEEGGIVCDCDLHSKGKLCVAFSLVVSILTSAACWGGSSSFACTLVTM